MLKQFILSSAIACASCVPLGTIQAGNDLAVTFEGSASNNLGFSSKQLQRGTIKLGTDPKNAPNKVAIMNAGRKKGGKVGKADLIHKFPQVGEGTTITMSGRFFFPKGTPLNSILLMDLECADCGPDTNPGIRMYLRDGRLRIDRSKIGIKDPFLPNSASQLKNGTWYDIEWVVELSETKNGRTTISVNGEQVLNRTGITLLSQDIVRKLTKRKVISAVDRFQIGLTANSNSSEVQILLDDVQFEIN